MAGGRPQFPVGTGWVPEVLIVSTDLFPRDGNAGPIQKVDAESGLRHHS